MCGISTWNYFLTFENFVQTYKLKLRKSHSGINMQLVQQIYMHKKRTVRNALSQFSAHLKLSI